MAQYVLINKLGTRRAGEIIDTVQDPGAVQQLSAFGGVLIPLPSPTLQPYIEAAQLAYDRADAEEAQDIMMAGYASTTAIAGGGTPGFVPIWTAGSVLGDSVIKQSGSLVGINVAAPTAALSLPSGVAGAASMNFGTGVAPGAPNSGDLWFDGTYLYLRAAGVNQPLNAPFGTGTPNVLTKWSSVSGLTDTAITEASGAIRTIGITNAGAGATNGTYSQQALTTITGTGTGATADIVVAGNVVTVLSLRSPGTGYAPGDTLSCATIGGGGFVFTVSAVSASDNASGNVTAVRVGAGTTNPEYTHHVNGVQFIGSGALGVYPAFSAQSTAVFSQLISPSVAAPAGVGSVFSTVYSGFVDCTGGTNTSVRAINQTSPFVSNVAAGSVVGITGAFFSAYRQAATDLSTAASTLLYGVNTQAGIIAGVGAASTPTIVVYRAGLFITATPHTIAEFSFFRTDASTFSAGATITNLYQLRLQPVTGAGTVTNRWGVSQEDALAKSRFYGNVGVGNALDVGAGKVIGSLTLTNGGTLYTAGNYPLVSLTGGTGSGATANIIVSGGAVTTLVLMSPGQGYTNGDVLSVNAADVGGTGSGFQATVATTASILRSDGTVIGSRIGGGTTNPVASIDGAAAASFNGFSQFFPVSSVTSSTGVVNYSSTYQMVSIGARAADYDCTPLGTTGFLYGINIAPILANLIGNFQGIQVRPLVRSSSGASVQASSFVSAIIRALPNDLGTMNFSTGYVHTFSLQNGAGTAASYNNTNIRAFSGSHTFSSPGTTAESSFFRASVSGTSTHTITNNASFWQVASTISGGTTIGTHYGLRLGVITITAPSAITNYWGVFQEDPAAKNQFLGNVGVGVDPGAGKIIGSLSLTAGGTLYTNGYYSNVPLTGGTGTGATADITISAGSISNVFLRSPGQGYVTGDVLSVASASVGGTGSGFQTTVGTVASILRSDGDVVAPRLGAGTTNPTTAMYAVGAISASKCERRMFSEVATPNLLTRFGAVLGVFDTQSESGGVYTAQTLDTIYGVVCVPRVDMSALAQTTFTYGAYFHPAVTAATSAGTTAIVGGSFDSSFDGAGITGKTLAVRGILANSTLGNLGAGNTVSFIRAVDAQSLLATSTSQTVTDYSLVDAIATINTTAVQTITNLYGFRSRNHGISGAAHVITNFYAIKLQGPTLSGGATITNNWGISQEDTLAKNQFLGNVGVGVDPGAGKMIASLTLTNGGAGYTNGTYLQVALTTVTGTGTGATADIIVAGGIVTTVVLRSPGQGYVVGNTLSSASIGAGAGFVLTVATTASTIQADGEIIAPRIGAGTTTPVASLHASGGAYFDGYRNFVTDNGAPAFTNQLWNNQALFGAQSTATVVNNNLVAQVFVADKFDTRSFAGTASTYSARFVNRLFASNAGQTVNCFGTQVFLSRDQAADDNATNVTQQAVLATSNANRTSGSTARLSAFVASASNFQAGHTVDVAYLFHAGPTTHAGTTTTLYGLRLEAPTVTGTITNRYWIAQEDTLGANYVRAKTFFGAAVGTAAATTASIEVTAQGTLNGDIRLNSANAVVDVSAASTNGVKFNNRGGAGITSTTQNWYEEGTYTPTLSAGWTVTAGNYAGYWTRTGRLVTLTIQFTGGTNSGATGGSTISTPAGLTPARSGAGTAVNANGTALGNGVVVVTTAATIINANAITTTTVDKTIVVQYEV